MPDRELIALVSLLSRLMHPRCRNKHRIQQAHEAIRYYAEQNGLSEEWCDAVLLLFLDDGIEFLSHFSS